MTLPGEAVEHQMLRRMKYYGDTVIGEKGQVVIPAEMRKEFGIETGDRFLVMSGAPMGAWGLILVKADVVSQLVQDIFGGRLEEVLAQQGQERPSPKKAHK
jgi:AbrB family looped-hinge helix DNA binding protein